jgi:hypothetical protein
MDRPDEKPDLPEEVEIHKPEPGKPGPSTGRGGTPPPPPPSPPKPPGVDPE